MSSYETLSSFSVTAATVQETAIAPKAVAVAVGIHRPLDPGNFRLIDPLLEFHGRWKKWVHARGEKLLKSEKIKMWCKCDINLIQTSDIVYIYIYICIALIKFMRRNEQTERANVIWNYLAALNEAISGYL